MLIGGIGRFGSFDSFRRELEQPCETGGNGKTENDQEDKKSNGPNWNVKHWKNLGDSLSEGPPADEVGGSNLVNIAPLQLGEETTPIHSIMDSCQATLF